MTTLSNAWEVEPKIYAVDLRIRAVSGHMFDAGSRNRPWRFIEAELVRVMSMFNLVCYASDQKRIYFGSPELPFLQSLAKLHFGRMFDYQARYLVPDIDGEADYYISGFAPYETKALLSEPKTHKGTPDFIQALQRVEFLRFEDYRARAAMLGLTPIPEDFFEIKVPEK